MATEGFRGCFPQAGDKLDSRDDRRRCLRPPALLPRRRGRVGTSATESLPAVPSSAPLVSLPLSPLVTPSEPAPPAAASMGVDDRASDTGRRKCTRHVIMLWVMLRMTTGCDRLSVDNAARLPHVESKASLPSAGRCRITEFNDCAWSCEGQDVTSQVSLVSNGGMATGAAPRTGTARMTRLSSATIHT